MVAVAPAAAKLLLVVVRCDSNTYSGLREDCCNSIGGMVELCNGEVACLVNIGALIITYTIVRVPDYNYCMMGPKTLF